MLLSVAGSWHQLVCGKRINCPNNWNIKLKYYCFALVHLPTNLTKPFPEFFLHSLSLSDHHFFLFCLFPLSSSYLSDFSVVNAWVWPNQPNHSDPDFWKLLLPLQRCLHSAVDSWPHSSLTPLTPHLFSDTLDWSVVGTWLNLRHSKTFFRKI